MSRVSQPSCANYLHAFSIDFAVVLFDSFIHACQTQSRASIGGGRGDASPTFQAGGQHRNYPPTFQFRKIAGHVA